MADVAIKSRPNQAVTGLKWTRTNDKYTLSWSIPANLTAGTNNARATYFRVDIWYAQAGASGKMRNLKDRAKISKTTTSCTVTVDPTGISNFWQFGQICGFVYSCNEYYDSKLKKTTEGTYPSATVSIALEAPSAPSWGSATWDATNAKVSCTMTGQKAVQTKPRKTYHCDLWRKEVVGGTVKQNAYVVQTDAIGWDSNSTLTYTVNRAEAGNLYGDNDYILLIWSAYAKGLKGNSSTSWRYLNIAKPAKPKIAHIVKSTSGKGLNVGISYDQQWVNVTGRNTGYYAHPVETAKLYIAYAEKKGQIETWTEVGDEISTFGKGFFISDDDITPEVGQHVFLKCKTFYQIYETESDVVMVNDDYYYTQESSQEDAPTSVVEVISTSAGEDNASVYAVIDYPNNTATYNACEISYSTDSNAWESTKQPDTYQMKDTLWQDKTSKSKKGSNYSSSSIKISELDEGTKYYVRARRYNTTDEDDRTNWSKRVEQSTNQDELTGLVLTAGNDVVATRKPISFSWEFPDDLKQTRWYLYHSPLSKPKGTIGACGTGSITSCSYTPLSADTHAFCLLAYFEDGRDMASKTITVQAIDAPKLSFSTLPKAPLTSLPQTFTVKADQAQANIQVKVLSLGIINSKPDGDEQQYRGDVVYSTEGTGEVTCTINDGSLLWDNGTYQVQAISSSNGVKSDIYTTNFTVNYSSTVTAPTADNVVITPTTDKGATVQVNNLDSGLTWDLYRATKDGRNFLIAKDKASGGTVRDDFAPFCSSSDSQYIVLVKNAQQQYDYAYYDYTAKASVLRFDWSDNFVELPYNIEISDETDKQFEQQIYLDGTQKGAWGASVIRTSSLSTDTIYITDEEIQRKVRELGRYQGAVFVRTPLGQAYTANVEVKDISKTYDSHAMAVSFDCTEIDLTSDFGASPVD